MRLLARLSCVFALFPIGGCTQVTGPQGEPVDIMITSWPGSPMPLEGVALCQTDTSNCETTDADGKATLWLPQGETSFTKEKEGFGKYLVPLFVPAGGLAHDSVMATDVVLETLHEGVMSPYPTQRITCDVRELAGPLLAGVTFKLFDVTGKVMEAKRYYRMAGPTGRTWSLDPTETTAEGSGGFLEVSPGEYSLQFGGSAVNCIADQLGWPGLYLPNAIRLPVRADYTTMVRVTCEKVP
jgi:hypothetical protein